MTTREGEFASYERVDGILNIVRYVVRIMMLLTLSLSTSLASFALVGPPQVLCASVELNGDVTLTWDIPPDPSSEFDHYEIFHSTVIGGPYTLLASIPVYPQTSYLHVGATGNSAQQFYFINTVSNIPVPNVSLDSDTIGTLFLSLNQSTPLGSALLDWTVQHTPPLTGSAADFVILMEYPIGTWTSIGQIPSDSSFFREVITICDDTISFRISLAHGNGCTSFSNVTGDRFSDVTPPSSPVLYATTVDTVTGLVTMVWAPSPEDDTNGYIIVQVTQTGGIVVDTIYGQLDTTYTDVNSLPGVFSHTYTVAAFDTCWSGNPPSPNTSATLAGHSTVFLEVDYDRCNELMHIDWTPYVGWTEGVQQYELYRKQNLGAPQLIATLNSTTLSFVDGSVLPFYTYRYMVRAVGIGPGHTSLSNFAYRITDYPPLPTFNYLRLATVVGPDHVRIIDIVDTGAAVTRYKLERAQNDGPWIQIDSKPPNGTNKIQFDDFSAATSSASNRYRIQVVDSCNRPSITSNLATSILLRARGGLEGSNHIDWNGYNNWDGQVQGYRLYRQIENGPFSVVATLGPSQWSFDDEVIDLAGTTGRFCYFVEAFETGNSMGLDTISVSNFACAIQEQQFWVPNAFVQDGVNNTFGPVTSYVDFSTYIFGIINRWGQVIWSTTDPNEKWDGKVNGKYVPLGLYGYYFSFIDGRGRDREARGTVTFIR